MGGELVCGRYASCSGIGHAIDDSRQCFRLNANLEVQRGSSTGKSQVGGIHGCGELSASHIFYCIDNLNGVGKRN
jgi:hypothetical protein